MKKTTASTQAFRIPSSFVPPGRCQKRWQCSAPGISAPILPTFSGPPFPEQKLYLVDVVEEPLKKAQQRFEGYAKKGRREKKLRPEQVEAILGNIVYTTDYNQLKNCDLVIEAATENLELKKKILTQVESVVAEDAIITSNTSGMLADQIFSHLRHPERTTITHFFAPAWYSTGVEVINWERADKKVVDFLLWFFAQAGKTPIGCPKCLFLCS